MLIVKGRLILLMTFSFLLAGVCSAQVIDTQKAKYQPYMVKLKERIEQTWKYPSEAEKRGIRGDVLVEFTIKKNGRVTDVQVVRTSGYEALDEAAIKAVKDGEPYWPLPDEWGEDHFTITWPFSYSRFGKIHLQ